MNDLITLEAQRLLNLDPGLHCVIDKGEFISLKDIGLSPLKQLEASAARVAVKLPAYRYLKDRSKGDETFSVYSEGYDNALDDVAEILRKAGIEIAE